MLERRLDNALYRMGLASSRSQARQMVLHGHVTVAGRKVNIPSYLVSVGEDIALKEKMHQNAMVLEALNLAQSQNSVPWLEVDRAAFKARVVALPRRQDVTTPPISEQLIVELYSK
jgi:small subunit ribosomal protein S4